MAEWFDWFVRAWADPLVFNRGTIAVITAGIARSYRSSALAWFILTMIFGEWVLALLVVFAPLFTKVESLAEKTADKALEKLGVKKNDERTN